MTKNSTFRNSGFLLQITFSIEKVLGSIQKRTSSSSIVVFSSCTFRSCWESTSPDSVPPTISFRYCWSILSMAAFRSFLKPCSQTKQPQHPPHHKLKIMTENTHTHIKTNSSKYLIYFRSKNLNLSESLECFVVRLSKQSNWLSSFSEATDYL